MKEENIIVLKNVKKNKANNQNTIKFNKKILEEKVESTLLTMEQIDNMTKPLIDSIEKLSAMTKPLIETISKMQINYAPFFTELQKTIEKAKENPDNLYNWLDYTEKLSDYIWTIPYKIESSELKNIFENVNSESEFDKYMRKYYKKNIVKEMVTEIKFLLPKKHKMVFRQIEMAYENKMYALSIIGMMSIIDELCAYFLKDKGSNMRRNLLVPIINDIEENEGINSSLIDAMILSNNINIIYERIDFNKKINIETKKQARRNPCQHGRFYSNRKTDAIMLLSTIYNMLIFQVNCYKYENFIAKK